MMPKTNEPLQSIRIHVDDEHIANAQRKNSHRCMIADALKTAIPEAKFISVDLQSIRFSLLEEKTRYFYFTPTLAQHAILQYDKGKKLRGFDFTMREGIRKRILPPKADKTKRRHDVNKGVRKHIVRKEREFGIRMFEKVPDPIQLPRLVKDPKILRANVSKAV
jgi:hypothetical protein